MGLWTSLRRAVFEGAGAGVNRRLVRFLGGTWTRNLSNQAQDTSGLVEQFLAHANVVVDRFGPAWSRRKVASWSLGVWLLLLLWVIPSAVIGCAMIVNIIVNTRAAG